MKCLLLALCLSLAQAAQFQAQEQTPMAKVVQLLSEMKSRIEGDGMKEQQSYDQYACWCENTLARKASDIARAKEQIQELQVLIEKLKGEGASHGAEIKQLEKDIQQNLEAQGEAKSVRDSGFEDYSAERTEAEQCLGALEAATKALAGAGGGKFLETSMRQVQLLSVVAGVRSVLARPTASEHLSAGDLSLMHRFVERPADFAAGRGSLSAAQLGSSPFGDYAPQSTQIQGILKGMYDTFASNLEKANANEADAQKAFEELMATKLRELTTLQETLQQQQLSEAAKKQTLAESEELQDATKAQLEADEKFFDETKSACKDKAAEWNERSRMRTMEIAGVNKAIEILSSPAALKVFSNATSTFLQVSAVQNHRAASQGRQNAYQRLSGLAQRFHDVTFAELAANVKEAGHFDKVIVAIDRMMEVLRAEEQADIEHRDRCENADGKNVNDIEDLNSAIEKAQKNIEHLGREQGRLNGEIDVLEADIAKTKSAMAELLALRNNDVANFKQALKDDAAAIVLLQQALAALTKFFEKNNIKLGLLARDATVQEPEYTVDPDKAPATSWDLDGPKYGGKKDETEGVVAIMEMLIEDLEKEMSTGREDDAKAQALYEEQRGAMQESLDKQLATKLVTERELADVSSQKASEEEHHAQKGADLGAEKDLKNAIFSDCSWVKTHFESRRTQRKTEMDGLTEAKGFLAGVAAGDS